MTLALSLHAPEDELRKTIMPVAKAFSIEEILKACGVKYIAVYRNRKPIMIKI